MSLPKWTDERTATLTANLDKSEQVSVSAVEDLAAELETSTRSVASKLRKLGYDVQSSAEKAGAKAYTPEQENELRDLIKNNSGAFTYAELAAEFANGAFSAKSVQGKVLSMELTGFIKPTPKAEVVKSYTADEENIFISMAKSGSSIEDIAQKLGKAVNSVRGKALSLLRSNAIDGIPSQTSKAGPKEDALESLGDISGLSVEEIAEKLDKTVRGVKTMLTRRGLVASDYDGAGRKEKAAQ